MSYTIHSDRVINTIRGKNLVGKASKEVIVLLFEQLDAFEQFLDDWDQDDNFGTEGWRHAIGLDD